MLGMYSLLPLLKGWSYKVHILEGTVVKGAEPKELRVNEMGWLKEISLMTADAYATLSVDWQGAELETRTFEFYAEAFASLGAFSQDPAGWCQKYYRPNPFSTAGAYMNIGFSGGWQGSAWPFVPTVVMKAYLQNSSTEGSAYIYGRAMTMAIIDKKAFIKSLRRLQDPLASLMIDQALLTIGPSPLGAIVEEAKRE